ncbi:MAG: diaminopimelate epimerase [Sphingomonadales bacterium 17-56-6]|nr:MAG: diaminopimelate epimerase [Sphingomonadales bacterium 17-56-6]
MDSASMPLGWEELESPMAVNIGNPHAVFFVDAVDPIDLERLGPIIEHDAVFPERVNVNVASIDGHEIHLTVWERGAGLTGACGTGACATGVAAIRQGKVKSPVIVHQSGGTLIIEWAPGQPVIMTGSATYVFTGQADWDDFG